jgi:23S rRNA (uracil1939-C5)-methyltransferase
MPSTVTIEKLVYGGDGLAHIDGQVLLAPFVLPGETVSVNPVKSGKGLLRAVSPELIEASPHRVTPRCEYFGSCGGCQYQHAKYDYQVEAKTAILRETLRRLGGVKPDGEIPAITADPWAYRNRIQLHFAGRATGFHAQGSHDLREIDHCHISSPLLVEAIRRIQKAVKRDEWPPFLRSLELFSNGTDLQLNILDSTRPVAARFFEWCKKFLPSLVPGPLTYGALGFDFRVSGGSFFQVNRFLIDALVNEVVGDAAGDHVVDLYAGVGLFCLPLSRRFALTVAVERGLSAFRDLTFNIGQSGTACEAKRTSAESYMSESGQQTPDLLVADPPRSGLGASVTSSILRMRPRRLALVSCDPSTLARDLRNLMGAYRIRRVALVDLFPQTYHFETVMHLESVSVRNAPSMGRKLSRHCLDN